MSESAKPEAIIAKLRQVEVSLYFGDSAAAAAPAGSVTEQTDYRWRKERVACTSAR